MLIYVTKYISRKVRKYGDSWEKCGVCVTFTGVCVLTQVVALSAVTLVRAVDVHTLVTTRTAQTLIHICIMTHTRSGSVNRIPGCRINSVHHPCSRNITAKIQLPFLLCSFPVMLTYRSYQHCACFSIILFHSLQSNIC